MRSTTRGALLASAVVVAGAVSMYAPVRLSLWDAIEISLFAFAYAGVVWWLLAPAAP